MATRFLNVKRWPHTDLHVGSFMCTWFGIWYGVYIEWSIHVLRWIIHKSTSFVTMVQLSLMQSDIAIQQWQAGVPGVQVANHFNVHITSHKL